MPQTYGMQDLGDALKGIGYILAPLLIVGAIALALATIDAADIIAAGFSTLMIVLVAGAIIAGLYSLARRR